jgi:hypothetical protein
MANVTELAATGNTDADHAEADRIAAAAAVDAHSTAIAEVDHQVVEADHLAAEATQDRHDACTPGSHCAGRIILLLQMMMMSYERT